MNRRQFVQMGAGAAATAMTAGRANAQLTSPNLMKWAGALRGLGGSGIPVSAGATDPVFGMAVDYHEIEAVEYWDQPHPDMPATRLWGYNPVGNATPRHLGGVIVARRGQPVRLRATNKLPSVHILPLDTIIEGYDGIQNKMTAHLHGGLVPWASDGGPHSWFDPNGNKGVSFQNGSILGAGNPRAALNGQADYFYPNAQSARLAWYHDHAMALTRLNAYAGIATGYLIVDPGLEMAMAARLGLAAGFEFGTPLVFQDKRFVTTNTAVVDPQWAAAAPKSAAAGSLWYAHFNDPKLYKLARSPKNRRYARFRACLSSTATPCW